MKPREVEYLLTEQIEIYKDSSKLHCKKSDILAPTR